MGEEVCSHIRHTHLLMSHRRVFCFLDISDYTFKHLTIRTQPLPPVTLSISCMLFINRLYDLTNLHYPGDERALPALFLFCFPLVFIHNDVYGPSQKTFRGSAFLRELQIPKALFFHSWVCLWDG